MTREVTDYRGMSEAEYKATVGAGKGIKSNLSSSIASVEGTNFSNTAQDAESYANYGKDDPRKTGVPNYLVEVSAGDNIEVKPDGYYHARGEVPKSQITRVWKMEAQDGAVVAKLIKDEDGPAEIAAKKIASLRDYAEKSAGTLRERVVIMQRATGEVIDDYEQELELDVAFDVEPVERQGSHFSNKDMFNEKGEYWPETPSCTCTRIR